MGRLDGKAALITGTAGGMGRAAALLFAAEGARVAGCDLKEEEAAGTVALVREAGGEMISSAPVDLGDEGAAREWVDGAAAALGGIDVLFNNASSTRVGPFAELTSDDWHYTIRNELDLVYHVTSAAWPHLVARSGGAIVNTSSMSAFRGAAFQQQAAHAAAKGGVLALTWQLAAAGAPHRIRANAIVPGLIRTPQTEFLYADPDGPGHRLARANPLGRAGYPEDVARLALFLASDESSYVNATAIPIDGGQSMIV
jgi:NAD(P)-dependent dehydrogenase (short-subunit alcohol dehydrogenase family)